MSSKVIVAGVGMIPFAKPGASASYHEMGAEAGRRALADAGVGYDLVEQAYAGYVYGDSTAGQRAIYHLGMTGVPIVNVNNNCSTGSTALFLARQAIASGAADCVLALGFEQMKPGALGSVYTDRPSAFEEFDALADTLVDAPGDSACAALFRRRRARPYEEIRHQDGGLCEDPRQGQPSRQEQPARDLPQGGHGRRCDERSDDLARRDDAADGLPAHLRRGGRDTGLRDLRQASRPQQQTSPSPRRR